LIRPSEVKRLQNEKDFVLKTNEPKKPNTRPQAFKPGNSGGPGRPKGSSGRTQALAVIDSILIEGKERLRAEFKKAFKENPIAFWEKYGQPLLPKEAILDVNLGGGDLDVIVKLDAKLEDLSIKALEQIAYSLKAGNRGSKPKG
jgi:hypothetical protein